MSFKNVVVIGGGTGSFTVLSGLKVFRNLNLHAIVTMADNGGSTGKLRDELGVLPPGDARQCLVALAESSDILRDLFNYRFDSGELSGHNFGNLFLSALEKITGNFEDAIKTASAILSIRGQVIPVTTENIHLSMTLENGATLLGEHAIALCETISQQQVSHIELLPKTEINPKAYDAIMKADTVIIGPGNFYCSLIPNMIVPGMKEALSNTSAQIIYNVNLMSKTGHSNDWSVEEHIRQLHRFIGAEVVDIALYNITHPNKDLIERYKEEGLPVQRDTNASHIGKTTLIGEDLIADTLFINKHKKDPIRRTFIRHDSLKLAEALYRLI